MMAYVGMWLQFHSILVSTPGIDLFIPRKRALRILWIGCWVCPMASLGDMEGKKCLVVQCIEPNSSVAPGVSYSLQRLRYTVFLKISVYSKEGNRSISRNLNAGIRSNNHALVWSCDRPIRGKFIVIFLNSKNLELVLKSQVSVENFEVDFFNIIHTQPLHTNVLLKFPTLYIPRHRQLICLSSFSKALLSSFPIWEGRTDRHCVKYLFLKFKILYKVTHNKYKIC
jgi:hypothetical protein